MLGTTYYSNRDIDAALMVRRLKWGLDITTEEATKQLEWHQERRSDEIRNYKDTRATERTLGELWLLLQHRKVWSEQGPFDDCSHWLESVEL